MDIGYDSSDIISIVKCSLPISSDRIEIAASSLNPCPSLHSSGSGVPLHASHRLGEFATVAVL